MPLELRAVSLLANTGHGSSLFHLCTKFEVLIVTHFRHRRVIPNLKCGLWITRS